ncbi:carboxymuconolactone decarboxylase family protein, partial [Cronobacter sakazakii]
MHTTPADGHLLTKECIMSRLQTIATETATGKTAQLFDTLKSA